MLVGTFQFVKILFKQKHSQQIRIIHLGIYSQLDSSQEEKVGELIQSIIPDISVTLSHKVKPYTCGHSSICLLLLFNYWHLF